LNALGGGSVRSARLGDQELSLLTFVAGQDGATVGEVADQFGTPRGLARSTVLTMMERLRQKRRLTRRRIDGVYRYFSPTSRGDVLRDVVQTFVEKTLGGSVSPFVAYLTESADLSEQEIAELQRVVSELRHKRSSR
jgi:predicted transcriptional regulator